MGAAISFPHDCYILRNGRIRGLWMKEGRSKEQERTCNSQIRKDIFRRSHFLFNRADHRATDNISWEEVEEYIVFRGFDRVGSPTRSRNDRRDLGGKNNDEEYGISSPFER